MPRPTEYHMDVRSWFPVSIPLLSLFGIFLFSASITQAQINAPPSSVTSPGFGGRAVNGPPASVTSPGPRGYAPNSSIPYRPHTNGNGSNHHRHRDGASGPYVYAYPVPYAVDPNDYADASDPNNDDSNYQGGPTVFDRRGSGERSYVPPVEDPPPAHAAQQDDSQAPDGASDPEPAGPPTLLVFKDGHKVEVSNYAIVGTTLFDLTPGHPRHIAVADIDLEATRKENDEHGIIFQLPPSLQAN
jgi:hypothetical protein